MEARDHDNSTLVFLTEQNAISVMLKDEIRERIKIEYYKTYDVMTGIRIAATLGGFFSMMILLVLYKNYCKPSKSLREEQLNAAVTAAAEEEDRALQAALEATSFYTALDKRKQSMENTSQILLTPRFSSVGGGYSHLTPPLKSLFVQQRGKSLPGSILQFGWNGSSPLFQRHDKSQSFRSEKGQERRISDVSASKNLMNIASSRRVSSATCFSADSSYLDRRCSALEMGLDEAYFLPWQNRDKQQLERANDSFSCHYPIDIQVTQPTPEMSPTPSEKNLNENSPVCSLKVPTIHEQIRNLTVANLEMGCAPLASISSLGDCSQMSLTASKTLNTSLSNPLDNPSTSPHDSTGSDSVFLNEEEMATDTEFEYDEFNDDYSFCETRQVETPTLEGGLSKKMLQLASFDSYDATWKGETDEEASERLNSQSSITTKGRSSYLIRRASLNQEQKAKRKLTKAISEPRSEKVPKTLPSWTEKERSKFAKPLTEISPSFRKRFGADDSAVASDRWSDKEPKAAGSDSANVPQNLQRQDFAPGSPRLSPRDVLPSTTQTKNALKQMSLPTTQERRSRLQKQKNFMEDVKPTGDESTEEKTEPEKAETLHKDPAKSRPPRETTSLTGT